MSNFKRFMSGSLAAVMITAAMMTGAQAKEYTDVTAETGYAEQIEILSDIGVIKGTSETEFSPDQRVTREQMSMLLFRLMLGKDSAGRINSTAFTDLANDTYYGAISWANASGYILGTSPTTFTPMAGITLQDAMTMLVRALGHSTDKMNSGYPWTYIDTAVKLGLDDGLEELSYTKELTRAEASAVLYNALTAEYLIPKTAPNGMTYYETTTIIERVFGYEISESVMVATNDYAVEGVSPVTKDGYVTLHTEEGLITVSYKDLGLAGEAEEHLGKNLKLVFKRDDKTKLVTVLGCSELSKTVSAEKITVGDSNKYIEIAGVKYQVVETLSDSLATNANELLVYAYADGSELVQIKTNAELSALLGAFDAKLIFDTKASETASRLIIKPFEYGKLQISGGKVNLAEGMKESDITMVNPDKAVHGSHVLYFFNKENKTLEISAVLPVSEAGTVTRLTATTAVIGGTTYTLGNEKLGITPESVRRMLSVGDSVRVVTFGDMILALETAEAVAHAPSKYLIVRTPTTPVFTEGKLGYVAEVFIDGAVETLFVTNSSVTVGDVYRYVQNPNGSYTLIPQVISGSTIESGDDKFVQSNSHNDEIAFHVGSASSTEIVKNSSYSTLSAGSAQAATSLGAKSSINFVTDDKTVIVIKEDGKYVTIKGALTSEVTIADGAKLTAIFDNEVGSVETLRFMFISDGSAGHVHTTDGGVKILADAGAELVNGRVYRLYTVLDLAKGTVETMMSLEQALVVGKNYLTNIDGHISATEADTVGGILSGYTGTTITVGGETYRLAEGVKYTLLNREDNTVSTATVADALMSKVELVIKNDAVISVVVVDTLDFEVAYGSDKITATNDEIPAGTVSFELIGLSKFDAEKEIYVPVDGSAFEVTPAVSDTLAFDITTGTLESGKYMLGFKVNGVSFYEEFTV